MWRFGVVVALSATACVVGSERPPSRLELARAPTEPPGESAGGLVAPRGCRAPAPSPRAPRPAPSAVWIEGTCRSTSIGTEWAPGHWRRDGEAAPPAYSWK